MNEWKYFLKYNINVSVIIRFKQYLPSIIQSVEFTGCVARQNNGLYVLHKIVKLAYNTARVHVWNQEQTEKKTFWFVENSLTTK